MCSLGKHNEKQMHPPGSANAADFPLSPCTGIRGNQNERNRASSSESLPGETGRNGSPCHLSQHLAVVVKTNRIPFWLVGEFTTHFRTYFSGWIGMFTTCEKASVKRKHTHTHTGERSSMLVIKPTTMAVTS